jgi:hypothetical protein
MLIYWKALHKFLVVVVVFSLLIKIQVLEYFQCQTFADIFDKIIPLFEEYPLIGVKANDYEDFKKVAVLIKSKAHLTKEGLDQICLIKSGMNFRRSDNLEYVITYT